jgi:hypothetical protein
MMTKPKSPRNSNEALQTRLLKLYQLRGQSRYSTEVLDDMIDEARADLALRRAVSNAVVVIA